MRERSLSLKPTSSLVYFCLWNNQDGGLVHAGVCVREGVGGRHKIMRIRRT
jgi:hypothetical protein